MHGHGAHDEAIHQAGVEPGPENKVEHDPGAIGLMPLVGAEGRGDLLLWRSIKDPQPLGVRLDTAVHASKDLLRRVIRGGISCAAGSQDGACYHPTPHPHETLRP